MPDNGKSSKDIAPAKPEEGEDLIADQLRRILSNAMEGHELTVNAWSTQAEVGNALYNFMSGQSNNITIKTLDKLARAIGESIWSLGGNSSAKRATSDLGIIRVRGELSAGAWLDAVEWPDNEQYDIEMPLAPRWRGKAFGLIIKGRSMNKLWPDGTQVVCIPLLDYGFDLDSGDDYVVVHQRNSLGLIEATAKRYEEHGNEIWLCPESDDPKFLDIKIKKRMDDMATQTAAGDEIYISAVILGGFKPTKAGKK